MTIKITSLDTHADGTLVVPNKLGIGTSSPASTLHLAKSGGAVLRITTETGGGGGYSSILMGNQDSLGTNKPTIIRSINSDLFIGNGDSWSSETGGTLTSRMVVTSSGNVGIGTSSPSGKVGVIASAESISLALTDSVNNSLYVKHTSGPVTFGTDAGGQIAFATNGFSERMRITSSGNVGIGTSSPSEVLHVVGNITSIGASSTNQYAIFTAPSTSYTANIRFDRSPSTQNWRITSADAGSSHRLYILDANDNDGVYLAQNSTSWTANSDSRLKDVQGTITDALAKVGQLTGVKFTWKRDADNPEAKVRVGLIAQDVQAVLPEAVDDESPDLITDEETGKVSGGLGVRYTEVVPLLVNAIKELTARVVTLEQAAA